MATIQKRKYLNKTSYQVRIRRAGVSGTITKSFMQRTDAKRWARSMEAKLDRGDYSDYSTAFIKKTIQIMIFNKTAFTPTIIS